MYWTRRTVLAALGALTLAAPARAIESPGTGIGYLERLGQPGALPADTAYLPPSRIDPAYTHAIYINAALSGPGAQKMWIVARDGTSWKLALHDPDYWADKPDKPTYSWPVSTGRVYPGNSRSGPTPLGIFNVDDRAYRHVRGWGAPGMYNSIFIDLHYGGGRISGVAMHGTTQGLYRLLGTPDSHGCIRMRQPNADQVWNLFHGDGQPGDTSPLWTASVPRYFTSEPDQSWNPRWNYTRDGTFLRDDSGSRLTKPGYSVLFIIFRDDL
ncbi:L,D-transpeptidase [Pseudoruegeria sp. HB172150]|uniref:L,D-transpeptidase n=1 Tax=Pseudoruegeria sp. HB172150 TaxID=2721164 RepID=UPI001555A51A|nr:L,D-transpeptidase [Pseudoruegeria sp. HB172150]